METKVCPYCAEPIAAGAKKCKHCGEFLDPKLRQIAEARAKRSFPFWPHIILSVITCGLWVPVWWLAWLLRDRRVFF